MGSLDWDKVRKSAESAIWPNGRNQGNMADATIILLADAVTAAINSSGLLAGYWANPPTEGQAGPFNTVAVAAVRKMWPNFDLTDLGVLHVTVLPVEREEDRQGLSKIRRAEYQVDVLIQQLIDITQIETVGPPLAALTEQINDLFANGGPLFVPKPANWLKVTKAPAYLMDELSEKSTFAAPQRLAFQVMR